MHSALSSPRLHQARNHVIAQYCPDKLSPFGEDYTVKVDNAHGVHFRTIGRGDSKNKMWLLPEEALYLIERGSLDIRWPEDCRPGSGKGHDHDSEDDRTGELPMSLQGAYASFIGKSGLTLERYSVFSGLRRLGYTVVRAPTWSTNGVEANGHARSPIRQEQDTTLTTTNHDPQRSGSGILGLINRLVHYLFEPSRAASCLSFGPLVAPGLYRSYNDIYRALALIPYQDPTRLQASPPLQSPFRITYHVYKPSTTYRKSNPPTPDFRVAVIDARESNVPTMEQIGALLGSMPDDELPKERPMEQRLKHGKRNVILAVVDMGVVSYLRFSEAGFGGEKLFENKGKNMRKGRKGGRGQGGKGRGGGGAAR